MSGAAMYDLEQNGGLLEIEYFEYLDILTIVYVLCTDMGG